MFQQLKSCSYEARSRRLNLLTLKYRRLRGDMIQVYNIVSGKYTTNPTEDFNLSNVFSTKGMQLIYKMQLTHMHYNLRKHFFSNLIIAVLNSLPNIIVNAESTIIYKIDWIDSGLIRKLNLIGMPTLPELEAEV